MPPEVEPEEVEDIDAKVLDTKDRDSLGSEQFAVPGKRKLPIHDAAHVRNALARFNQTEGLTPAEKKSAMARIHRAAKKFGISVDAGADEQNPAADIPARPMLMTISAMRFEAVSLNLPTIEGHPNRMPFSGILTRIDSPSDRAPNGAFGKRIMLTRAAAESALPSLMGMGIGITKELNGHDAQNKIGLISSAHIEGDALMIEGFIYAADFPREAIKIHLEQDKLGFSFEAQELKVDQPMGDPIVIRSCVFTGAAILMKNDAAYMNTSLAAAAAQEHEMTEAVDAVKGLLAESLKPITDALAAQAAALAELQKAPNIVMAVNAAMSKVEPHAMRLEAAAEKMEQDGVGSVSGNGHAHHLRRMADSMRADGARGKIPDSYHDSGYFASAAPVVQAQKVEETPEYKALKASQTALEEKLTQVSAQLADAVSSMQTRVADITAASNADRQEPTRKTVPSDVMASLNKYGIELPEDGKTIPVGKIDKILADAGVTDLSIRMDLKKQFASAGLLAYQN
jgi:hypothetical protein